LWAAFAATAVWTCGSAASAQVDAAAPPNVRVVADASGSRLQVDGEDFMLFGMNWDYFPIGENYLYDLWKQPDDFIEAVLAREMPLLKSMGVNTIRVYVGITPRWVQHIYERYGIYTVVNHPMARYGYTLDGVWIPSVDYSNARLREAVKAEIVAVVDQFRGTPGVLMWLLGNENNYGLSWSSFEIEALPEGERDAARARHLYSLFEEVTAAIKTRDRGRPVAIANGDLQYLEIIAQECRSLDVLGTNVYRGISARDLYQRVRDTLGIPIMYTEFGADAFNAKEMREDQITQARYLIGQWQEIYEQSSGKGRVGNAIGGFVFQWVDGWWKFGQESRLDIHDTNASWPNAAYPEDYVEGDNNMNEEWWGICAKGRPDQRGFYELYPRAAYYALRQAWQLPPYAPGTDVSAIQDHFAAIEPAVAALEARADRASDVADALSRVRVSGLRLEFETFYTGGTRISTPPAEAPRSVLPSFLGFDHLQSFYADFEVKPTDNVTGTLSLNVLGHVPLNPIDEIFYENRGIVETIVVDGDRPLQLQGLERVKVYRSTVSWDDRWFRLDGFYREGHTHWGYEGDFFGLYRDAYYGENIDIYNADGSLGVELSGKKWLDGLKFAFGPELYWGANPQYIVKYRRRFGPFDATGIYQDEFAQRTTAATSSVIPVPRTQRATLHVGLGQGGARLEVGGIWAGESKIGQTFQIAEEREDGYDILLDRVRDTDTFGAKAKLTFERGRFHWYAQGAYAGIVADGGATSTITFTGWTLKDTGLGNGVNLMSGLAVNQGRFQVAPNVLWQKPLVGPIPSDVPPPGRPRNVIDDPFAVRANREMMGAEILLNFDPTPATWMWAWDNDTREDAPLAASLGFTFRHFPTTQDAAIGFLADGTAFPFPGAPPPRDLWEARVRVVSSLRNGRRLIGHFYTGTGEPNGEDPRRINRFGGDARLAWSSVAFAAHAKFNDWGPYDYHRDFNLTFPVQLMGDLSYTLGRPRWFGYPQTRIGVRGTWRSLDRFSPRYCPAGEPDPTTLLCDPTVPGPKGSEWEIRTYLHISL
jgi:hypothetical protein